ncbi:2-oxoglutarate-Fe(II) type oxidoreductase [Iris pallida]|uniref:2-oxoglutarate-Fe(II) type oxidoreductase n=1 Tax=Iris pallida TaxID=29817 RepID=A0AAX6G8B2_IRIPA|nr:2-oxoglutarate-Fe(II) type oxidoreductase [Iris pallida]
MAGKLELPLVDLSSPDSAATARTIRQACLDCGFFYLINHGVEKELLDRLFLESGRFFSLPLDEKMKLEHNSDHRGYSPMYAEKLDPSSGFQGDPKESFYIGPGAGSDSVININQWPTEETLPFWRDTMETYYGKVLAVGIRLISLIALALNLDSQFFERIGALYPPMAFLRLLHYPGELIGSDNGNNAASAHSDYGMVTLLATDGVPGLQICREKDTQPLLWEDVHHVDGAFIVNVGDMLERWTNCLFRSTLHRVLAVGQERYSVINNIHFSPSYFVAFFLDPNSDCLVECLESCCSEKSPARFPPIRSGDYLQERLRVTYSK